MDTTAPDTSPRPRRRLRFALTAILGSATIATLIHAGLTNPHPNLKSAYLLCLVIGAIGLIQLGVAVFSRSARSLQEPRRVG